MSYAAPGSSPMLVAGDPVDEKSPYLETSEDQRILIDYCRVLDQIFEAAMLPGRWRGSVSVRGLGRGFGIGLVALGVGTGWGIESSPM